MGLINLCAMSVRIRRNPLNAALVSVTRELTDLVNIKYQIYLGQIGNYIFGNNVAVSVIVCGIGTIECRIISAN